MKFMQTDLSPWSTLAQTGKMKTYSDAIEAILNKSVMLSPETLDQIDSFMKENLQLSYTTKEESTQDAARFRLGSLVGKNQLDTMFDSDITQSAHCEQSVQTCSRLAKLERDPWVSPISGLGL